MRPKAWPAWIPSVDRCLLVAVVTLHVVAVVRPLDVLAPVDAGHLGRLLLHGKLPYKDFRFEYPPFAILAFVFPGLAPAGLAKSALALEELLVEVAVVLLVLRHHEGAIRRYGLLSLLVFPFLAGGFDAFAMAAITLSTAWLVDERAAGWWMAGAGALVKLSPAVAWVWCRRRGRAAVAALAATSAVGLLPALWYGTSDRTYLGYTLHRGVQVESLPASITWLVHLVDGARSHYAYRFKSWEIAGAGATAGIVLVLAAAGLVVLAVRAKGADPWVAALATVLLVLCASKVLSPQYLAWGAPLAALVSGRLYYGYLALTAITLLAYSVGGGATALLAFSAVRNLGLVGLTLMAVRAAAQPGRS